MKVTKVTPLFLQHDLFKHSVHFAVTKYSLVWLEQWCILQSEQPVFIVWLLPVAHVVNSKPVVKLPCNLEKKNLLLFLELSSTDTPLPAAVDTPFGSECLQSVYLVNDRLTHDVCLSGLTCSHSSFSCYCEGVRMWTVCVHVAFKLHVSLHDSY